MSYYEQSDSNNDLPSFTTTDANKILKIDNNGLFVNWSDQLSSSTISANNFYAGDGTSLLPSYSFKSVSGADTGISYEFSSSIDRMRFSTGGALLQEMNTNQSIYYNRVNCNSGSQSSTVPGLNFHFNSTTTGYAGEQTNAATDPRLWAIVNGILSTELTRTNFNIGLNTSNNTNMKTVNVNGPSNFNTFTPSYSLILTPTTNTNINPTGTTSQLLDIACNTSNGVYVICSNTTTAGHQRLFVSEPNDLTTWTAITDSVVNMTSINSVVFGNGVWACLRSGTQTRQYYYTTDITAKTGWTQIPNVAPWTTSRNIQKLKFINNQFVSIDSGSRYRVSNDGINWSLEVSMTSVSSACGDLKYSPQLRRYVCVTTLFQILYYDGTSLPTTGTNVFTAVSVPNAALQSLEWSPKLGLFVTIATTAGQPFYISKDGINWTSPGSLSWFTKEILWVNDYGGFFMASPQQATNNLAISPDGINWSFVPLSFTATGNANYYNPITKMFVFTGTDIAHFRDASTIFNSYVDSDNIYNTFNSNVRLDDTIEYKSLIISPVTGNNHFTVSSFTKSSVDVDTTNANFNIYLQGSSYNNKIGMKFTIYKYTSSNHNVRIHGYETTNIISPLGNITSFNAQSSPQFYNLIPAGYFGSFELIRVSDVSNGTWLITNLNVYDNSGTRREINNLSIANNLSIDGSFSTNGININRNYIWTPSAGVTQTLIYDINTHGSYVQINAVNNNQTVFVTLPNLNIAGYQNKTFLLTFDLILDNARTQTNGVFSYSSPTVRLSTGSRPAQEYNGNLVYEPRSWRLDTPGGALTRRDYRGGPISFLVSTNSNYTWYRPITNDDDFIEDVGSINCIYSAPDYYINVNNSNQGITFYKYNDVIGAPSGTNVILNFETLTYADNKWCIYFTMTAGNTTGNFNIRNNMSAGDTVVVFSAATVQVLSQGQSLVRDGQTILRCIYHHSRFGNPQNVWVIQTFY